MDWQPIETAPAKKWIMLKGGKIEWRSWGESRMKQPKVVVARLDDRCDLKDNDRWMVSMYDTACGYVWYEHPTHWMPLPKT